MNTANRITAVITGVFGLLMMYEATKMKSLQYQLMSESLFPNIVFGMIVILSATLFISTFITKDKKTLAKEYWIKFISTKRLILLTLFVAYLLIMPYIGFLIATGAFILLTVVVYSRNLKRDIPIALGISGGMILFIYLLFVQWLEVFLP